MAVACLLKNSRSLPHLLLGRFATGVATSLLFSAFEAWAVADFAAAQLPAMLLPRVFSLATFGNALGAIGAGLLADRVAADYGPVGAFNAAVPVLVACGVLVGTLWAENRGVAR